MTKGRLRGVWVRKNVRNSGVAEELSEPVSESDVKSAIVMEHSTDGDICAAIQGAG